MILLASFTKSDDAAHVFNYRPCWAFHEFVTMTMNTVNTKLLTTHIFSFSICILIYI